MRLKHFTTIATVCLAVAVPASASAAGSSGVEHKHGICMHGFNPQPRSYGAPEDANGNGVVCSDGSIVTDDYRRN